MLAMELRTIQSARPSNNSLSTDYSRIGLSPFIKWAGGKSSLIDHLLPFVPLRLSNYYEPFLGGGALFLAICGRSTKFNAFLSDTNRDLINAFMIVKTRPFDLIRRLARLRSEYKATRSKEDYYYDRRGWKPRTLLDLAARFIFLNKTCYTTRNLSDLLIFQNYVLPLSRDSFVSNLEAHPDPSGSLLFLFLNRSSSDKITLLVQSNR